MIHLITEENSELKHRTFPLPKGIRKHLKQTLENFNGDKTVDGYKRLNNILDMNTISYHEMKRIKNFFDTYSGTTENVEYILNGGDSMKTWINNTLNTARNAVEDFKQAKKDAGMKNAFIKSHEKQRQIKKNKPTMLKIQTKNINKNIADNDSIKFESKLYETVFNIPKKVINFVNKFNAANLEQQNYMEDKFCLMDEDGNRYYMSPITIEGVIMKWETEYDDYFHSKYDDSITLMSEEDGEVYFNEWDYDDYTKSFKRDLKRGFKYFNEFGAKESDYEDGGEERVLNRMASNESTKKNKTIFITEEQYRLLKEAMNDTFSFEELSSINSFNGMYQYCLKHLGQPQGRGSSRVVFQLSDEKVIKLALNNKGLAQNDEEWRSFANELGLTPKRFEIDKNDKWIVVEYVLPARVEDFKQCIGIDFNTFCCFIRSCFAEKEGKDISKWGSGYFIKDWETFYDMVENNEDLNQFHYYISNTDVPMGDLLRKSSYGMAMRNGNPEIVLLDSGLSNDVWNNYYS